MARSKRKRKSKTARIRRKSRRLSLNQLSNPSFTKGMSPTQIKTARVTLRAERAGRNDPVGITGSQSMRKRRLRKAKR